MCSFVVNTVLTDGLASLDGIVMTESGSHTLDWLKMG